MSLPTLLDTITRSMGAGSREHSISTIDTLKGVSLIAMFHTHFAWAWRATDWYSLLRFEWYTTDFVSTATLLTMSLVGSMVGIQARREFGDESMYTRRKLLRMSFLFLVGELMNLMFLPALGPFHALVWNALTGIAFFSLLLPLAMRLPPVARLAFAAALALLYFPIVDWLMVPMNQAGITPNAMRLSDLQDIRTLIYFLFFNHAMMVPPYTWAIAMLVTSVVFQGITSPAAFKSPDRFTRELKRVAMAGACLIAIGISTGAFLMKDYDAKVFNELFLPGAVVLWPFKEGMLGFLVRHTPQAIMYQIGIVYVWFACLGWLQVLRK
ncbi:MAG: hypothetical protein GYA24_18385, partial [Candidatus Lokiarchaeota archaeon]|nr:hypothetical protein [Candidatus Lokiarchaeota archaeon]